MWFFSEHNSDHGEQILRWTFLFAAPNLFKQIEITSFSFLHFFVGILLLTFVSILELFLTKLTKEILKETEWKKYGRVVYFCAQIIYNVMIASQIWIGLVLANIIEKIFNKHNDMLIFSGFSIALIFFLAVLRTTTTPIENLR